MHLSTSLKVGPSINLYTIKNEQILGMLKIEPGSAGWEARMLPLFNAAPLRASKANSRNFIKVSLDELWPNVDAKK